MMTEWQRVTAVSRESVIDRLRAMSEVLPEGSFGRTALSWAADDMEKQEPTIWKLPAWIKWLREDAWNKEKGWPRDCLACELYGGYGQPCEGRNAEGKCPCEVMSRKLYKYLKKEANRE